NVELEDAGTYKVVVSNDWGSAEGTGITLDVINIVGVDDDRYSMIAAIPNPVTYNVQSVEVNVPAEFGPVAISIVDMLSRELARSYHSFGAGQNAITIPVHNLANGMYHIVLHSGKRRTTIRLLVAR